MDEELKENLGIMIDSLDNLAHGLNLPLSPEFHLQQLKKLLPNKVVELKAIFIKITGENPWE